MAKVIAIGNQKGGCGKTTTAVNLSAALALYGKNVLLIDMDPQGNASLTFGINIEDIAISMSDVLLDRELDFKYNIFKKGAVHVAPSNPTLNYAEERLRNMTGRVLRLRQKLEVVKSHYDYVLIDCPPNIGLLTTNALMAADNILIPIDTGFYSLVGIKQFLSRIEDVQTINPALCIMGILVTKYSERSLLSTEVYDEVKNAFGDKVFMSVIRNDIKLAEAPGHLKSVFEHSWSSRGAQDYLNLAREVIQWKNQNAA